MHLALTLKIERVASANAHTLNKNARMHTRTLQWNLDLHARKICFVKGSQRKCVPERERNHCKNYRTLQIE